MHRNYYYLDRQAVHLNQPADSLVQSAVQMVNQMFTWSQPAVPFFSQLFTYPASCSLLHPAVNLIQIDVHLFGQLFPSSANCSPFLPDVPIFSQLFSVHFLPAVPFNSQLLTLFIQIVSLFSQLFPSSANCSPFLPADPFFSQLLTLLLFTWFSLLIITCPPGILPAFHLVQLAGSICSASC